MPVAPALLAVGLGTAVAGVAGAAISSDATSSAAQAQTNANNAAIAEEQRQFNTNQANYAPWLAAGKSALGQQLALLGLGNTTTAPAPTSNADIMSAYYNSPALQDQFGSPAQYASWVSQNNPQLAQSASPSAADQQQAAIDQLKASPLYQSLFRNGQDTLLNNAAATGGLRGGNTARSLANFGSDTLSQVIQNQLANLGSISGLGNNSAGASGQLGQNNANSISSLLSQNGQSQAGGILGGAGIWNNTFNGLGKTLGNLFPNTNSINPSIYADSAKTIAANPGIF